MAELAGGAPAWTAALNDPPCFENIGNLTGTFATTWGSIGAPDPFVAGDGTNGAVRAMKAAGRTRYGPPEVVRGEEVPTPEGGDRELRVHVTTVNRTGRDYRAGTPVPSDWSPRRWPCR